MKTSNYQLCEMLRTATGYHSKVIPCTADDMVESYLAEICDAGLLKLPFEPESVFVFYDRIPVLSDIQCPPAKSLIVNQLSMRREDTGLVVDSLRSGKAALYFAHLCNQVAEAMDWIGRVNFRTAEATVKYIDDEHMLIVASVRSFVPSFPSE